MLKHSGCPMRGDTAPSPLAHRLRQLSAGQRREEARAFLETYHEATGADLATRRQRWAEVRRDLARHDHYEHSPEELAFGARLAWRNSGRCIGRLFWESLEVADCRAATTPEAMHARMIDHMEESFGDGRIKSLISVFAPVRGKTLPAWIESTQIAQYACHRGAGGGLIGDRQNLELTRTARAMGWQPPQEPGPFDLLPYMIRDANDRRHLFTMPQGAIREVPIRHPDRDVLDGLGLRWYAVPVVTNMIMTIGGIDYPCAPFNGFYMGTEIGSRNFADQGRYDLLAQIATALGLDPEAREPTLWRDTALTELNRAVLHSFRLAGVTMVDHHTASEQFMTFHQRELAAGRRVAADWRWIVPPQAAAACEVFHLKMRDFHPVPNYYRDRAGDGLRLMPWYGDKARSRREIWADRIARRWRVWNRMPT